MWRMAERLSAYSISISQVSTLALARMAVRSVAGPLATNPAQLVGPRLAVSRRMHDAEVWPTLIPSDEPGDREAALVARQSRDPFGKIELVQGGATQA